ncbi:hypothetical protein ACJ41O_002614 [Fusarium nematophilum]
MSQQRRPRASSAGHGRSRIPQRRRSGLARYASVGGRGIADTAGSVWPAGTDTLITDGYYTQEPVSYASDDDADITGSHPGGTTYTSQDPSPYSGGVPYANSGNAYTTRASSSNSATGRAGGYHGRSSLPRYLGAPNPRQTYPLDHYDAVGNYIGPPPPATSSSTSEYVQFPRLPDPEPTPSPEPIPAAARPPRRRLAARLERPRRSLPEQIVDGVRSLFHSASDLDELEFPPQPARTGTYLFCRHYLVDSCACITPLEPNEAGDYCQRCWEGRCSGPAPPGSTRRRAMW